MCGKGMYINNDSTPREKDKYRELNEEVQRRVEAGENGLIIRNLTIVKRKPRQKHEHQVQHCNAVRTDQNKINGIK